MLIGDLLELLQTHWDRRPSPKPVSYSKPATTDAGEAPTSHGIFEIPASLPLAVGIEELVLIAEVSLDCEWEEQVRYLPLR
jgi:hypothetical protein